MPLKIEFATGFIDWVKGWIFKMQGTALKI